jgi:hypothetical protein
VTAKTAKAKKAAKTTKAPKAAKPRKAPKPPRARKAAWLGKHPPLPLQPGVCIPWELRVKEYPQILGDVNVVKRVWEEIDTLAYLYVWANVIQF